jgi:AcrR family transcriptional regulator
VDAAERLFGIHGLDGVSLREIGAAAGCANNFAVQYHFNDKAGLVRAIFERRLPTLEVRRAQLLSEVSRSGRLGDSRALTEVLFAPIAEQVDAEGAPRYAAFLLRIYHEGSITPRDAASDLAPFTKHVGDLLRAALPNLPQGLLSSRLLAATAVFNHTLIRGDRLRADGSAIMSERACLSEALDLAHACLQAPISPDVAAELDFDR